MTPVCPHCKENISLEDLKQIYAVLMANLENKIYGKQLEVDGGR